MQILKGDIVCVHGTGIVPKVIEGITHSPISHVALVNDPYNLQLIEAQGFRTVGFKNLQDYAGCSFIMRYPELTEQQVNGLIQYAAQQIGLPYDYLAIFEEMERYLLHKTNFQPEHGHLICSTLVEHSYRYGAGIFLTNAVLPSPDDLFNSTKLKYVGKY